MFATISTTTVAQQPVEPATIIATPGAASLSVSPNATALQRTIAYAESWYDEPSILLPDRLYELEADLPVAIAEAKAALNPSQPSEVVEALQALATRRGYDLPEGIALEMDVEVLASWPRDLFVKAFHMIWERFAYRRLPEVADFHEHIKLAMSERRERLARLESLKLRLETVRLRERLDEQARRRHAARQEREREAMRTAAATNHAADQPESGGISEDNLVAPSSRRSTETRPTATSDAGAKGTAAPDQAEETIDTSRILGETIKVPFPHPIAVEGVATPEPITLEVVSRPSFRNTPSASIASLPETGLFGRQDRKTHRSEPIESMILLPKSSSLQQRCRRLRSQHAPLPARFCRRVFRLERLGKFYLAEADREPKKKAQFDLAVDDIVPP
jgi:hypothetical protein